MIASPMPMRTSPWWLLLLAVIAYGGSVFGAFLLDDFSIFSDPRIDELVRVVGGLAARADTSV